MHKLSWIVCVVLLSIVAGCDKEGPAEQAGERIDEAVEDARQQAQDVRDEGKELADDVADAIDRADDDE